MRQAVAFLAAGVACLAPVTGAIAQDTQATYRLSWDVCDHPGQVVDKVWAGPGVYTLVLSGSDFRPGDARDNNVGHDFSVDFRPVGGPLPDAWRFDDVGCQTGSQLALSTAAFSKTCPAMEGTNPLSITFFGAASPPTYAQLRLANTYDKFTPVPATRYTFWVIGFDHSYSVADPTTPGVTCGEVDRQLCIGLNFAILATWRGVAAYLQTTPMDYEFVTWNGPTTNCGGVPTLPATWGSVKSLYR